MDSSRLGGKSLRKKLAVYSILIGFVLFLTGCQPNMAPITSESTGIWAKFIVYPMSQLITFFADIFNNYGWGIIIVTIIIRLFLLPLNIKQLKSSQAMQKIQPEMKKLQEKYSSKDQQTQQKLQQEMMALFKEHKVNPLAGCLPLIVQMPFLIGIYQAIMRTEEIGQGTFLWFQLGTPDMILPLITGAAMFLQQKLMMAGNDAAQNPQMQIMLYLMPIMIMVFAFFFPAALALYWVVGSIFMIGQTLLIRRPIMDKAESGGGKN